jgi:hypothetical protein
MKDRMVDHGRRRARVWRDASSEHDLSALLLTGGTSLRYFIDINWWLSERL